MKYIVWWDERPYSPYLMSLATSATVKGLKKIYSKSRLTEGCFYWKNAIGGWFFYKDELFKTIDALSKDGLKNPKFLLKILEEGLKKSILLREYSEKFKNKSKIKELKTDQLITLIEKMAKLFYEMYGPGTVPSIMGYQQDGILYKEMMNILNRKVDQEKLPCHIADLTSPSKKLKNLDFELEMLKISKKAKKLKLKNKKQILKIFNREIKEVAEKYEWLSFDLCNKVLWKPGYYVNLIIENINSDTNEKIYKIKNYEKITAKIFKKSTREIGLTKNELKVFELIKNLGYYKWAREYEFVEGWYYLKFVMDEFGRRFGLTSLESKYLLPEEFRQVAANPKKFKNILKNRLKFSLLIYKKNKISMLEGREAEKRFKSLNFFKEKSMGDRNELKGMPANSGKAKGVVKIINKTIDLKKMREGDILISQATNPELVPAMKKAAAIVTDEGGVTCHAAIVSRELNKPCVIGTRVASKSLKDGDLVEVDANKGVIKILK